MASLLSMRTATDAIGPKSGAPWRPSRGEAVGEAERRRCALRSLHAISRQASFAVRGTCGARAFQNHVIQYTGEKLPTDFTGIF